MATALKDGDQHRPGTCSERGKSPLDPGSILPTPRIVGKSRNPVASWRLGRLAGASQWLGAAAYKQRGGGATSWRLWGVQLTPTQPQAPGGRGWRC